jgi:hypothetical protein
VNIMQRVQAGAALGEGEEGEIQECESLLSALMRSESFEQQRTRDNNDRQKQEKQRRQQQKRHRQRLQKQQLGEGKENGFSGLGRELATPGKEYYTSTSSSTSPSLPTVDTPEFYYSFRVQNIIPTRTPKTPLESFAEGLVQKKKK